MMLAFEPYSNSYPRSQHVRHTRFSNSDVDATSVAANTTSTGSSPLQRQRRYPLGLVSGNINSHATLSADGGTAFGSSGCSGDIAAAQAIGQRKQQIPVLTSVSSPSLPFSHSGAALVPSCARMSNSSSSTPGPSQSRLALCQISGATTAATAAATTAIEPRRREGKFAPLLRRRDDRDARRHAYLARSRQQGADRLYEARAEQVMRREWLDEQAEWHARMEARHASSPLVTEEEELEILEQQRLQEELMLEEDEEKILMQAGADSGHGDHAATRSFGSSAIESSAHDMEMEPPLPDLSQPAMQGWAPSLPSRRDDFWSEDEDFERSLLEAALQIELKQQQHQPNQGGGPDVQQQLPATSIHTGSGGGEVRDDQPDTDMTL